MKHFVRVSIRNDNYAVKKNKFCVYIVAKSVIVYVLAAACLRKQR